MSNMPCSRDSVSGSLKRSNAHSFCLSPPIQHLKTTKAFMFISILHRYPYPQDLFPGYNRLSGSTLHTLENLNVTMPIGVGGFACDDFPLVISPDRTKYLPCSPVCRNCHSSRRPLILSNTDELSDRHRTRSAAWGPGDSLVCQETDVVKRTIDSDGWLYGDSRLAQGVVTGVVFDDVVFDPWVTANPAFHS